MQGHPRKTSAAKYSWQPLEGRKGKDFLLFLRAIYWIKRAMGTEAAVLWAEDEDAR